MSLPELPSQNMGASNMCWTIWQHDQMEIVNSAQAHRELQSSCNLLDRFFASIPWIQKAASCCDEEAETRVLHMYTVLPSHEHSKTDRRALLDCILFSKRGIECKAAVEGS